MSDFVKNLIDQFYKTIIYDNRYQYIIEGIFNTLIIAFFAVIIGLLIGLLIGIVNSYNKETGKLKILNKLLNLYVTIIRGTPVVLQLMIIYYVIFRSVDINVLLVGIIAFSINSGAYVSEIVRAGIESVDVGQKEAAYAIGFNFSKTMTHIILPQALKNILPALGNEFITLLKETSVAGYIGIVELTKASDIIASRTYNYFFPLTVSALIYLCLTLGLKHLLSKLESRLK